MTLGEFAAVLTGLAGILGAVFAYLKWQGDANTKTAAERVTDLQDRIDDMQKDGDARITELRRDFEWQRQDWARQMTDLKQAMTLQAQTISRQEIMISDYARHVAKLERIMAASRLEIPDFETTPFTGAV